MASSGEEEPAASADEATAETAAIAIQGPLFPIFPVVGAVDYSDTFGAPRHPDRQHQGTDIFAPKMTPVVACAPGTVIGAGVSSGRAGVYVKVRHDNGAVSVYLHLNNDTPGTDDGLGVGIAPGIAKGAEVEAGSLLGFVGDSGNAETTPPHLHFEYRLDGAAAINPYPLLMMSQGYTGDLNLESLPYTGFESKSLLGIAVTLLLAGAFLLRISATFSEQRGSGVNDPRKARSRSTSKVYPQARQLHPQPSPPAQHPRRSGMGRDPPGHDDDGRPGERPSNRSLLARRPRMSRIEPLLRVR